MNKVKKVYECPCCEESLNRVGDTFKVSFYNLITFGNSRAKSMHCTGCMRSFVVHEANKMQFLSYKKSEKYYNFSDF